MTTWELAEKPKRKGRQFAIVITKDRDLYVTGLVYYPKAPRGSLGYLDKEPTLTPARAKEVGRMMLKRLKRGRFDRVIEEDLKRAEAYAKFG
jgi:hypothetical protein